MMSRLLGLAFVLAVSGCAGREPAPVQMARPGDMGLTCGAIAAEEAANRAQIGELEGDQRTKVVQNVAAVAAGVVFTPLLFLADFQGAAGVEIAALKDRDGYLEALAGQRGCGVVGESVALHSP